MNDRCDLARGWLLKARSDLHACRRTLETDGPYDTTCFHAQQAIEKALKALLAFHGQPVHERTTWMSSNESVRCLRFCQNWVIMTSARRQTTTYWFATIWSSGPSRTRRMRPTHRPGRSLSWWSMHYRRNVARSLTCPILSQRSQVAGLTTGCCHLSFSHPRRLYPIPRPAAGIAAQGAAAHPA